MMATYALVVGIDAYQGGAPPLRGCVADAEAMAALLAEQVPGADIRTLLDAEATRTAFAEAFVAQLGRAQAGDTAVLWFSGHGSQVRTVAGDGRETRSESLVFVDSRLHDRDLVDRELGQLIARVTREGAHVVVGLDCCHSGGGTRDLPAGERGLDLLEGIRHVPADARAIALDDPSPRSDSRDLEASGWQLGGAHVLLAACRSDEKARERMTDGRMRGVFTVAVERALRASDRARTYRELLSLARNEVASRGVTSQTPQLEFVGGADPDLAILSGERVSRPPHFVVSYDERASAWAIDGGGVHGLPTDPGAVTIAIHTRLPDGAPSAAAVATAQTAHVEAHRSLLGEPDAPGVPLDRSRTYIGVLSDWALARVGVRLGPGAEGLRDAMSSSALLAVDPAGTLRIDRDRDRYRIVDAERSVEAAERPVDAAPADLVALLERIARWHHVERLAPPSGPSETVRPRLEIVHQDGRRSGPGEVLLPYAGEPEPTPQRFEIGVHNDGTRRLYVAVLALSESYGIANAYPGTDVLVVEPGQRSPALRAAARVPDDLYERGVTRRTDVIKVIASTAQFDVAWLLQRGLDVSGGRDIADVEPATGPLTAGTLLREEQSRDLDFSLGPIVTWDTLTLRVVSERPRPGVDLEARTPVAPGIEVVAPPGLRGRIRLASSENALRDLGTPLVPPLLAGDPDGSAPFGLVPARGLEPEVDVIEFYDLLDPHTVTPATPLEVRLEQRLPANESVVVIGFDGTDYLPVGYTVRAEADATVLRIVALPDEVSDRSLVSAVRLLVRRLWRRASGRDDTVIRLAIARIDDSGAVRYDDDPAAVARRVSTAARVLLVVHGIIGETTDMVPAVYESGIAAGYDVVLAFDYENLDTSIARTAEHLAATLREAGITASSGTTLDIVAHSMGGLVSRWMIERVPSSPPVARLVTAGTPNGGSPWPTWQNWATVVLTLGLNQLASAFWPAAVVGWLVGAIEKFDTALDEMQSGSNLLRRLSTAPDPHVDYVVIMGDRALAEPAVPDGRIARLLGKLVRMGIDSAVALAFHRQSNDIAVALGSGHAVPAGRIPAPVIPAPVACDHLTYFSSDAGRQALRSALGSPVNPSV